MARRIVFVLLVAAAFAHGREAIAIELSREGKSAYTIVVADDATAPERSAAFELKDYCQRITGAALPIVRESDLAGGDTPRILIGQTKATRSLAADVKWETLGSDGIVMRSSGDTLILAGGRPRGTIYAVDSFLEDVLGVRWWTSDESFVPRKASVSIDPVNVTYTPKLIYRECYYDDSNGTEHGQFAVHLKLDGHHQEIAAELGGHYKILGWCHTSFNLMPPAKYFKDHPEWYAMAGGKRRAGSQLCLSSPQMRKELIKNALELVRKNPEAGIISISQNDTVGACECPDCKKILAEEGSESGAWIRLANEAASEIDKEYPNFLVETLAYWYTRTPPKLVRPSDHVLVRLCSIECDFCHPLSHKETNQAFASDMDGWAKIAPNLFVWNYVTNFGNYLIPHPNMTPFDEDLRWFVDHHVVGVFEQGDATTVKAGDMLPLRCWLLAHLLWKPDADQTALRDEFLNGYFGAAGPSLAKYLDLINGVSKQPNRFLPTGNNEVPFLTADMVKQANALFDEAKQAVAGGAVLALRATGTTGHGSGEPDFLRLSGRDAAAWERSRGRDERF